MTSPLPSRGVKLRCTTTARKQGDRRLATVRACQGSAFEAQRTSYTSRVIVKQAGSALQKELCAPQDRKYVSKQGRALHAESLGRVLTAFLLAYFPDFVDYGFTSALEAQLDDVSGARLA